MSRFPHDVVDAVLAHMNTAHAEDNITIVRAFGRPEASTARMVDLDSAGGLWAVGDGEGEGELRIPWGSEITERPQIHRAVVTVFREACRRLGVEPHAGA